MIYQNFSKRQLLTLTWWNKPQFMDCDGIICDGSIRSGKTVSMTDGFILWSMSRFNGQNFAICGKTIESLRRNVITLMPQWLEGIFSITERRSENKLIITSGGVTNSYYMFGGKDESSYTLVQGITLAGVLFDEVALMPRSFVEQAMARCSVAGSKFWFNCNPENPAHWFYTEWIKKAVDKNCLYLHFTMDDNPSLSEEIKQRYKNLYSGSFYERFIEGKWVSCDGAVYPFFDSSYIYDVPVGITKYFVSCDYGTVNPTSMGLWGEKDGTFFRVDEFYHDSKQKGFQMTDEEYYCSLTALIGDRKVEYAVVDPSAASFIECIKRHGKIRVVRADNDVVKGIRKTSDALKSGRIKICKPCRDAIREFSLYRWDESAKYDAPRKENDHAMDDIRYFVMSLENSADGFFAVSVER